MSAIFLKMEERRLCVNAPKNQPKKEEEVVEVKPPVIKQEAINVDDE